MSELPQKLRFAPEPQEPVRVLHLITDLNRGGAEIFLRQLVSWPGQSSVKHQVVSLTTRGEIGPELQVAGIAVEALSLRGAAGMPLATARLVRTLRSARPHVLMTWLYHADLMGTLAATLSRETKLVWNIRCADMDLSKYGRVSRALPHMLARLSSRPDVVVTNSEAGRAIHSHYGYQPRRWEVLQNGIDTRIFRPDPERRARIRAALGVGAAVPLIGIFARFDPMKDHATFLAAAQSVAKAWPSVKFLVVGRGTDEPAFDRLVGERDHLRQRIIALGERRDVPDLMAAADLVVCSSVTEGFPNIIAEAMASGVPCVSTDVGDARLIMGDTGRLVPKGQGAALAQAMIELLSLAPDMRVALGAQARRRIEQQFSLDAVVKRYGRLFSEVARAGV